MTNRFDAERRRSSLPPDVAALVSAVLAVLAQITAASVQGVVATGERAGRRVRRRLSDPGDGVRSARLCSAARGFSLHAANARGRRRSALLCRFLGGSQQFFQTGCH